MWCTGLTSITIPSSVTDVGDCAFNGCTNLKALYFKGNAPSVASSAFVGEWNTTIYYLPGTLGWGRWVGDPWIGACPTALWRLPYPVILTSAPDFGVQTNAFGFRISWATNPWVVVEASTGPFNGAWAPLRTNRLVDGWGYFSDPEWTNYRARFYRVRSL